MLPGLRTREELDRISAAVDLPILAGSPADAMGDRDYLASRRVRLWSSGHHTLNVAMNSLYEAMKSARNGTLSSQLPGAAPRPLVDAVTSAAEYETWTRDYLGAR